MPLGGCHGYDEWVSGVFTDRCPVMFIDEYALAFEAYSHIDKSLPYSGGSLEQPVAMMQAIGIIGAIYNEHISRLGC